MNMNAATTEAPAAAPLPAVAHNNPGSSVIALPDPVQIAVFAQQMQGLEDTLSFDRIKVGKRSFEVPTGDGDDIEAATVLEGVILYSHPSSVLFLDSLDDKPDDAPSNRPDAWSSDGITQVVPPETIERCRAEGKAIPSTVLAECPYNKFGSDPKGGKGKWTQNRYSIYIMRSGEAFPKLLSLSPTSLSPFGNYMGKRLLFNNLHPQGVVTRVTVAAQSSGNREWGECRFAVASELSPDDRAKVQQLSAQLMPLFTRYAEVTTSASEAADTIDAADFIPAADAAAAIPTPAPAAAADPVDADGNPIF